MIKFCVLSLTWIILQIMTTTYAFANDDQWLTFVKIISKNIPKDWQIIDEKDNVIPFGHYDGLKYSGPKGKSLVLMGNVEIDFFWIDNKNKKNYEPLFKEALEIWIMPENYHESWKKYFIMKRQVPAIKIFFNNKIKVYGMPFSVYSPSMPRDRLNEIISQATKMGIVESPHITNKLSWSSWEKDIRRILISNEIW
jgi:hypothetical protein